MNFWLGILAILVGLVSCFYGYPLFRVILIFAGLIGGYMLGQSFVQIGAGVVGLLFFLVRDLFVMLTTALNGAVEVVYGIGLFVPTLALRHGSRNLVAPALVIGLCSLGVAVQYGLFKDRRMYSPESKK